MGKFLLVDMAAVETCSKYDDLHLNVEQTNFISIYIRN